MSQDKYTYTPDARVWAQGDDIGYGFHGDFTNGWPEGLFTQIVGAGESCAVLFEIANCPPLSKYFTGDRGATCQPDDPSVVVNEEIGLTGPVAKLPGDNPIWNGGAAPNKPGGSAGGAAAASAVPASGGASSVAAPASAASSPAAAVAVPPAGSSAAPVSNAAASAPPPASVPAPAPAPTTSARYGGWGGWRKRRLNYQH
uniref:Uncharacterized protein n=1 Tax=Kwoniella bestiolae CBS 10118 TaxID=1296100 RepID=A0A1B9G6Z4_9TREE|nr:hypothetical protein I302_04485 [Kwoniella bestiolae CBS 10118]OCF26795.1 hypothetical protein I302_04485 [Kwoniella bestiolae CBS 10118]